MAHAIPSDARGLFWTTGAMLLVYYVLFAGGGLQLEPDRNDAIQALQAEEAEAAAAAAAEANAQN